MNKEQILFGLRQVQEALAVSHGYVGACHLSIARAIGHEGTPVKPDLDVAKAALTSLPAIIAAVEALANTMEVEGSDECRGAFESWQNSPCDIAWVDAMRCFSMPTAAMWVAWQAAWNTRTPSNPRERRTENPSGAQETEPGHTPSDPSGNLQRECEKRGGWDQILANVAETNSLYRGFKKQQEEK